MKPFQKHTGAPGREKGPLPDNKDVKSQLSPLLFGMSMVFHFILFAVFFLIQDMSPPSVELPMVKVNLVSLDAGDVSGEVPPVDSQAFEDLPDPPLETGAQELPPEPPVLPEPVQSEPSVAEEPSPSSLPATPKASEPEPVMEVPVKIPLVDKKSVTKKETPPPPTPSPVKPAPVKPAPVKPAPVKPSPPEQKLSLKKKTYRPEAVIASAKKQIAQSVKKQDENSLDTALTRLRKKVATQTSNQGGLFGARGGPVSGSADSNRAIDLYNLELMYRIQQNWAFNRQLAGGNDAMEVRILIKILKSGQIRDIWFETRSGNRFLDESALKAVKKSNPLSPLPRGYNTYDVGLVFTPSGLM
ncbi:cell envelope integrity protein TolA [Desulfocicer niacini]